MKEYDCIIIGSGIAGMTAAIYLKRANVNVLIIESTMPGGQMQRSSIIENYPGYVKIDGPTLASNIYEQVTNLDVPYLYDEVIDVDFNKNIVKTDQEEIKYKYLIIATGRRPRKLNLDNERNVEGKGLSYCALCDGNLYKDKDILVVGGGNSAVEEALYLANICNTVTIVYRGNKLNAEESFIDKITNTKNIKVLYNSNIKKYNLNEGKLESIILDNNEEIKTDGIFMSIGQVPNAEIFDLEKEKGYIVTDNNYKTSIDNVYACGDIIKKQIYQLTTAVGEATLAASNIIKGLKMKK